MARWQDRIFDLEGWLARHFPPLGRLIDVDGQIVHAHCAGPETRLPIVLLHGASGNMLDWQTSILPELARRHQVIALDRPGFGYSSPPRGLDTSLAGQVETLRGCLHRLGHRRYVLIGHSYSGPLVMRWALDHPDEVAGLSSISGATNDWGGDLGLGYRLKGAPIAGRIIARIARLIASPAYLRGAMAEVFAPQEVPETYADTAGIEFVLRPLTFRLNAAMMRDLGAQVARQAGRYGEIACPIAIIHGTADTIVPMDVHAKVLSAMTSDSELTLLDGVGHMPHHHRAGAEVIAALDRLAGRAQGLR